MSSILEWKKVSQMGESGVLLKALLYADSGVGKTATASKAPKPVFLLTEPNGLPTIRAFNPNAVVIQADEGNGGMDTVRAFLRAAKDGTLKRETGAETVVLDSMNELQRMLRDEIMRRKKKPVNGEEQFTLADWGVLTDKMRGMVRAFRDLPFHVIGITHADVQVQEGGPRHILPMFMGRSLPNEIAGYFSLVGYMYRKQEQDEKGGVVTSRHVLLQGPPTVVCKGLPGLEAVEEPNPTVWLEKLNKFNSKKRGA